MNVNRNLDLWRCKVAHKNEERYSWVQTNRSVPSEGNNPGVPYGAVINLLPLQQTCNSNQTINHLTNQPTQQSSNQSTQSSVWSSWPYIYILVRSASKLPLCVCVCVCVCVVCVCVCVYVCVCSRMVGTSTLLVITGTECYWSSIKSKAQWGMTNPDLLPRSAAQHHHVPWPEGFPSVCSAYHISGRMEWKE